MDLIPTILPLLIVKVVQILRVLTVTKTMNTVYNAKNPLLMYKALVKCVKFLTAILVNLVSLSIAKPVN